jgi:hypothetical protein
MVADGSLVITGYATDPVETKRRTLFMTSLGLAGRNPPPDLLRLASTARKNSGIEVRVRDKKSGAGISGAQVYYDGKLMGRTSETDGTYLIEKPGTGSHSVRVVKPGYSETTIMADGTTGSSLSVRLQPSAIRQIYGDALPETALDSVFGLNDELCLGYRNWLLCSQWSKPVWYCEYFDRNGDRFHVTWFLPQYKFNHNEDKFFRSLQLKQLVANL